MRINKTLVFLPPLVLSALLLQACSPEQWQAIATGFAGTQTAGAPLTVLAATAARATSIAATQQQFIYVQTRDAAWTDARATDYMAMTQTAAAGGGEFVSVTVDTFCRSGPGANYDLLGTVTVGQKVQVVAVYSGSEYVVVRLPDGSECWLWLRYAEPNDFSNSGLPEAVPPPAPTPTNTPRPPRKPTATPTFTIN